MIKSRILLTSLVSLLFLSGCTKNLKYESRRLTPLTRATSHSSQTKENVTVSVKSFDTSDQTYYFGHKTSGLHPVQITVNNDSDTTWVISRDHISLPLADTTAVANKYKTSGWASVALGILSWPLGIMHGYMSHTANKEIEADIADKSIETSAIINPESHRNAVLFSRSDNELQRFTVTLIDADNPSHTLNFNLSA
jgi:hypothetical protein